MTDTYRLTPEGKNKLEEELTYLKNVKQKEVANQVKEHRGYCDFSENATFEQTLDQQTRIKERIAKIEEMLVNAKLIGSRAKENSEIQLGDTVTFMELPNGPIEKYTIVSSVEADPLNNKISGESPIGIELVGSKKGDEKQIEIPSGKINIKILNVQV